MQPAEAATGKKRARKIKLLYYSLIPFIRTLRGATLVVFAANITLLAGLFLA
jgi:hypothetical protein